MLSVNSTHSSPGTGSGSGFWKVCASVPRAPVGSAASLLRPAAVGVSWTVAGRRAVAGGRAVSAEVQPVLAEQHGVVNGREHPLRGHRAAEEVQRPQVLQQGPCSATRDGECFPSPPAPNSVPTAFRKWQPENP